MRRLLIGLFLLLATPVWAAPARVSGSHASGQNNVSASAQTLNYGGNLTSGSLLVAVVSTYNIGITVSVADGTNGSYAQAGSYSTDTDTHIIVSLWYKANNSATGTPTVTVTPSGSAYVSIGLDEFTGLATSSPLRNASTADAQSPTITTATVTATAGDLAVAGLNIGSADSVTSVNSPFTISTNLDGITFEGIGTAYDLAASGSEACTFNVSGTTKGPTIIASFIPASAATSQQSMLLGAGK